MDPVPSLMSSTYGTSKMVKQNLQSKNMLNTLTYYFK